MFRLKFIPPVIIQFVKAYFILLVSFTLFRLILFLSEIGRMSDPGSAGEVFYAFVIGLRFDLAVSGYLLILPYLLLCICSFIPGRSGFCTKIALVYIAILGSLSFLVCAIDIPYFNQFFSRLSVTAFGWLNSPVFVVKMIFQEPRYWLIGFPLIIIIISFVLLLKRIFRGTTENPEGRVLLRIACSVLFLGIIFLSIRGRFEEKTPLTMGVSYFSNNAFLNQLGLNPNFTLMRSYMDNQEGYEKNCQLMNDAQAVGNLRSYLNITSPDLRQPLLRKVDFDSASPCKYNVVLVIMESMSAGKTGRGGNRQNLTPFLDSISGEGYYFKNAYSAGIHTFNGIFSTLFSFPSLFREHPMRESSIMKYHGISSTLRANGYSTIFFIPHDGQFDNVEGFLKANDFETVISKPDYPPEKVKTTMGVPDDYMFEFSIPVLNKLHARKKPFFAAFMTASDHGPYYIPDYFKPTAEKITDQSVQYADFSLNKFIRLASRQPWFQNTIFVFVADHGTAIDYTYELSVDHNHTPLIFYAPAIIREKRTLSGMAGQIDVFPTIMGLLKQPYSNNTPGIDLLHESRPYIFFNADDKYGVMDNDWFLIVRNDNTKALYQYRTGNKHNFAEERKDLVEKMNVYAQSNFQASQYIVRMNKQ